MTYSIEYININLQFGLKPEAEPIRFKNSLKMRKPFMDGLDPPIVDIIF